MYRTKIKKDNVTKNRLQSAQLLKEIPFDDSDIYHEVRGGESLNTLAKKYYGADKYWRVIAHANNISNNFPKIGEIIRIPQSPRLEFINE